MKNRPIKRKKKIIKENFDEKYGPKPNSSTKKSKLPRSATEGEEEGDDDYASFSKDGNYIDYSKTLESAYSNLENILGDGGMENISKTTKNLMEQQKMLMENMKSMEPFIAQAETFINKVGGSKTIGKIMNMFGNNKTS